MKRLAISFFLFMLVTACVNAANDDSGSGNAGKVEEKLILNGTFEKERYSWSLELKNKSQAAQDVEFSSGQEIEVTIENKEETLYRYSADKMFTQAFKTVTLESGGTRHWSEEVQPDKLESGSYTITFEVLANKVNGKSVDDALTTSEHFTIR